MSENYMMLNGKKVEISDETAANIEKQILKLEVVPIKHGDIVVDDEKNDSIYFWVEDKEKMKCITISHVLHQELSDEYIKSDAEDKLVIGNLFEDKDVIIKALKERK